MRSFQSELIQSHGYPVEEYEVTTRDGYILEIQRIPHGRHEDPTTTSPKKTPVLLLHGVLATSAHFVLNSPNQSLGEYRKI